MQIRGGHRPGEIPEIEFLLPHRRQQLRRGQNGDGLPLLEEILLPAALQGDGRSIPAQLEEVVELTAGIGNPQRTRPCLACGERIAAVEKVDSEVDAAEQGAGDRCVGGFVIGLRRPRQGGSRVDLRAVALDREAHHAAVACVAKRQWWCWRLDDEVGIERAGDQEIVLPFVGAEIERIGAAKENIGAERADIVDGTERQRRRAVSENNLAHQRAPEEARRRAWAVKAVCASVSVSTFRVRSSNMALSRAIVALFA